MKKNLEIPNLCLIFVSSNNQNTIKMKEMFTTLNQARKENPKEFYGSFVFLIGLFATFYVSIWIFQ